MTATTTRISYPALLGVVTGIFAAYLPEADARRVAECIVEADLRGVSSHGITRIPVYTRRLREGLLNAKPNITVEKKSPAVAHINGDNAMGYIVAARAMDVTIAMAKEFGVGMAVAHNSNHFGMAASHVRLALDQNLGAIVLTNAPPLMPVWGGRTPFLGTSPFAMGMPGGKTPLLLDMATSLAAFGSIRRAARLGKSVPADWGLDKQGRATTDPQAIIDGGVVLPIGGPKGSGLGLMIEAVAGVMSGANFGGQVRNQNSDFKNPQNVGHFFLVFTPEAAMPFTAYTDRLDELVNRAKASELADGFSEILMPGEREDIACRKRKAEGFDFPAADIEILRSEAKLAGISFSVA